MLIENGHTVDVAFNIEQDVNPLILEMGCKVNVICFARNPLKLQNFKAYKELKKLIKEENYDLVHTHTPTASMLVRLACRQFRRRGLKVFYTAHGFHFFKGAPLLNWVIYYPIEKCLSRYTDVLITINKEDYARSKNKFHAKNVEYIPGVGIDVEKFVNTVGERDAKRGELAVPKYDFMILSVGELNSNKDHEVIIRAIAKLERTDITYAICGTGHLRDYLNNLARELGVKLNLLGYRTDIAGICKSADLFAFPSKREGLGLAAIEAMACGLPLVTSNVHGIVDYSTDGETGYTCDSGNVSEFMYGIEKIMNEKTDKFQENNIAVASKYSEANSTKIITQIYSSLLEGLS
jgi:glycosyltransferase involved in cell wall biosynthesis